LEKNFDDKKSQKTLAALREARLMEDERQFDPLAQENFDQLIECIRADLKHIERFRAN
jgi:hypothetical protein